MPTAFALCWCLNLFHGSVSGLRSSKRTCGFPASGSPTGFMCWLSVARQPVAPVCYMQRQESGGHRVSKIQWVAPVCYMQRPESLNSKLSEDIRIGESPSASRGHLVTPFPPSPSHRASSGTAESFPESSGSRQSPRPWFLQKHPRSEAPSLHQHYPASTVVWASPIPGQADAQGAVESRDPSPFRASHVSQLTFPACHSHYPGERRWVHTMVSFPIAQRPSP